MDLAQRRLMDFIAELKASPGATRPTPPTSSITRFRLVFTSFGLGAMLKHSCGLWPPGVETLDGSEEAMLRLTCERAELSDGQTVLELGCGWGSLSLLPWRSISPQPDYGGFQLTFAKRIYRCPGRGPIA